VTPTAIRMAFEPSTYRLITLAPPFSNSACRPHIACHSEQSEESALFF
jgi:hypothetical protein